MTIVVVPIGMNIDAQKEQAMNTASQITEGQFDMVLIGAGIMSATLAVFLKELQRDSKIAIFEGERRARKLERVEQRRHRPCGTV